MGRARCRFISLTGRRGLVRPELYVKGLNHLSGANLSGKVWEKKTQPARMKRRSLTNEIWHREGEKAFLAAKSFYLISSPPWLEPSWVWLKWDRHLLGSAAAERLLSDFVFVPMHSAAKILTSTTQQGQHGAFTESRHSHKRTQMEESINSAYRLSSRAHESRRVGMDSFCQPF